MQRTPVWKQQGSIFNPDLCDVAKMSNIPEPSLEKPIKTAIDQNQPKEDVPENFLENYNPRNFKTGPEPAYIERVIYGNASITGSSKMEPVDMSLPEPLDVDEFL